MAEYSAIEWTDSTFNPWEGCQKVGPGCDNCYAENRNARFGGGVAVNWGPGAQRRRTSVANWRKPVQWNAAPFFACPDCGRRGDALAMGDEPKHCSHANAKPARRRVFCASLADVFDNEVPEVWRDELVGLITSTPNLDWLLLTKRIGNVSKILKAEAWQHLPHVLIGATIVNQVEADRDIPKLLAVPARVRFLSIEPMLGPIDLRRDWLDGMYRGAAFTDSLGTPRHHIDYGPRLHWVIAGGESGPHARPAHPDWFRSLRDQCAVAGVPFLHKQNGEWAPPEAIADDGTKKLPDVWMRHDGSTGGGFFEPGVAVLYRAGKKAAGRLLDGVEHNGFPA